MSQTLVNPPGEPTPASARDDLAAINHQLITMIQQIRQIMNLLNRARLIMHFAVTNDAYQADRALQRLAETVQFEARHRH